MQTTDFDYPLPEHLIAQYPLAERTQSRLLHCDRKTGALTDRQFSDILGLLQPNDCLIFNNTKVMPARLYGQKPTGGKVEMLIERLIDSHTALVHVKSSKGLKPDATILLQDNIMITMQAREQDLFRLHASCPWLEIMEKQGEMPLPPYMLRHSEAMDTQRYQTVYAQHLGAIAAPTAGLHFDESLLKAIKDKNIATATVTLHVGAGTFQPVRVDNIHEHVMHSEWLEVNDDVCTLIHDTKQRGGRVVAVGTTTVRSLETAARSGSLKPYRGDTDIFIYPGYEFKVVDAMITNFHLPKSTLIMLVSAFSGVETIRQAYAHAIAQEYRFFSYGDAMFLA